MPALNRMSGPRGPRFYDEDGQLMFVNVLDASTRFGPRAATAQDAEDHPAAFSDYRARLVAEEAAAERAKDSLDKRMALQPTESDFPGRPLVTFADPAGGPPAPEPKPYAERRARAAK